MIGTGEAKNRETVILRVLDEALLDEHEECLADRTSADIHLSGERGIGNVFARLETAFEKGLANSLNDAIAKRD